MSTLNGVFTLRTPCDLLEKLEADFVRLAALEATTKAAQYAAFDFFVCAEHLADWQHNATGASLSACRSTPKVHSSASSQWCKALCGVHCASCDGKRYRRFLQRIPIRCIQSDAFQSDAFGTTSGSSFSWKTDVRRT